MFAISQGDFVSDFSTVETENDRYMKSLGLDPDNKEHIALILTLYELGLKEFGTKTPKIFSTEDICLRPDLSSDQFKLSVSLNNSAFETGKDLYREEKVELYNQMNQSIGELYQHFQNIGYRPNLSIRSYADGQRNELESFQGDSAISKNELFPGPEVLGVDPYTLKQREHYMRELSYTRLKESSEEPKLSDFSIGKTDSQRANFNLARSRGRYAIEQLTGEGRPGATLIDQEHIDIYPYHTPGMEHLTRSEAKCDSRRKVIFDLAFEPQAEKVETAGTYYPKFTVAGDVEHNHMILASAMDAARYPDPYNLNFEGSGPGTLCNNMASQLYAARSKEYMRDIDGFFNFKTPMPTSSDQIKERDESEFVNLGEREEQASKARMDKKVDRIDPALIENPLGLKASGEEGDDEGQKGLGWRLLDYGFSEKGNYEGIMDTRCRDFVRTYDGGTVKKYPRLYDACIRIYREIKASYLHFRSTMASSTANQDQKRQAKYRFLSSLTYHSERAEVESSQQKSDRIFNGGLRITDIKEAIIKDRNLFDTRNFNSKFRRADCGGKACNIYLKETLFKKVNKLTSSLTRGEINRLQKIAKVYHPFDATDRSSSRSKDRGVNNLQVGQEDFIWAGFARSKSKSLPFHSTHYANCFSNRMFYERVLEGDAEAQDWRNTEGNTFSNEDRVREQGFLGLNFERFIIRDLEKYVVESDGGHFYLGLSNFSLPELDPVNEWEVNTHANINEKTRGLVCNQCYSGIIVNTHQMTKDYEQREGQNHSINVAGEALAQAQGSYNLRTRIDTFGRTMSSKVAYNGYKKTVNEGQEDAILDGSSASNFQYHTMNQQTFHHLQNFERNNPLAGSFDQGGINMFTAGVSKRLVVYLIDGDKTNGCQFSTLSELTGNIKQEIELRYEDLDRVTYQVEGEFGGRVKIQNVRSNDCLFVPFIVGDCMHNQVGKGQARAVNKSKYFEFRSLNDGDDVLNYVIDETMNNSSSLMEQVLNGYQQDLRGCFSGENGEVPGLSLEGSTGPLGVFHPLEDVVGPLICDGNQMPTESFTPGAECGAYSPEVQGQ